jgi:hypothetical protein
MSTMNLLGAGKVPPARKADNFVAICKPIVYTMWDPQHLRTLHASAACYGDSFTLRRSVLPVRYELDCKYCYK